MIIKAKFNNNNNTIISEIVILRIYGDINNEELIDNIIENENKNFVIVYKFDFVRYCITNIPKDIEEEKYFNAYIISYYEEENELYCDIYIEDKVKEYIKHDIEDIFNLSNEFVISFDGTTCNLYIDCDIESIIQ